MRASSRLLVDNSSIAVIRCCPVSSCCARLAGPHGECVCGRPLFRNRMVVVSSTDLPCLGGSTWNESWFWMCFYWRTPSIWLMFASVLYLHARVMVWAIWVIIKYHGKTDKWKLDIAWKERHFMKKERMEKFGFSSKNYVNMHLSMAPTCCCVWRKRQIFGSHEPSIDLQQNSLTGKVGLHRLHKIYE